ncbi:hypothetical protein [Tellurirhabdus rosea]|uniref:hypothetical protein n=1 Tax=Tellurirhabdus rosea TaxID=2674997 RepID=UPI0022580AD8|nr:hypothetical protein [Tellurirhabdus rosea]
MKYLFLVFVSVLLLGCEPSEPAVEQVKKVKTERLFTRDTSSVYAVLTYHYDRQGRMERVDTDKSEESEWNPDFYLQYSYQPKQIQITRFDYLPATQQWKQKAKYTYTLDDNDHVILMKSVYELNILGQIKVDSFTVRNYQYENGMLVSASDLQPRTIRDGNIVAFKHENGLDALQIEYKNEPDLKNPHLRLYGSFTFWTNDYLGKPTKSLPIKHTLFDEAGKMTAVYELLYEFDAKGYVTTRTTRYTDPTGKYASQVYGSTFTYQ